MVALSSRGGSKDLKCCQARELARIVGSLVVVPGPSVAALRERLNAPPPGERPLNSPQASPRRSLRCTVLAVALPPGETAEVSTDPGRPCRLFISYSHADQGLKDELLAQLAVVQRSARIEPWSADRVDPGTELSPAIEAAIAEADVAVLLLSSTYFTSQRICDVEIPKLFERHTRGEVIVVPVVVGACLRTGRCR